MRVEKRDYSRKPWRVLEDDGQQVFRRESFEHPTLGMLTLDGPVCFDTKRDAAAWVSLEESA